MLTDFFTKIFHRIKRERVTVNFGVHLTIDGYGGDPLKLNNRQLIYKCLDESPGLIGMNKLGPPLVLEAPEAGLKDSGGYSGFVIINTSHVSCHTFPRRRFVSIDVYSCADQLDIVKVKAYFREAFSLKDLEVNYFKRGTRFPAEDIC